MSQFTKKLSLHFLIILLLTSVVVFYSSSQFSVHYKNHRPKEIDSQLKRHASFTLKANPGEEVFDCSLNPDQKPCYQGNHIEPMYFGGLVRGMYVCICYIYHHNIDVCMSVRCFPYSLIYVCCVHDRSYLGVCTSSFFIGVPGSSTYLLQTWSCICCSLYL